MIPLHVDATVSVSDAVSSDELDACVDCVGNALGEQLQAVAAEEWPELRQLYADCVLLDLESSDEKNYRFTSKDGQLVVNCTVDCRPLLKCSVEEQTIAVLSVVAAAAAKAFSKRSRPRLALVTEEFRSQLSIDFVKQCNRTHSYGQDSVSPQDEPIPVGIDGRIRHVRELPDLPGELWLMGMPGSEDVKFNVLMSQIEAHMVDRGLGRPNGSAVGTEAFDLSFDAENLAVSGAELDRFLRASFPQLDYLISDDYEPILEEKDRDLR